jgi:hypothetical protein
VHVQARISRGALLQVGFDYWRDATVGYSAGGNNHEAGASKWYLPPTTGRKLSSATSPAARPTELAMSVSPCLSGETPYFVPVK